jgi:hypothetical protein
VIILSEEDKARLIRLYGISPEKIEVITIRLDLEFLRYKMEEGKE